MSLGTAWSMAHEIVRRDVRILIAAALVAVLKTLGAILAISSTTLYVPGLIMSMGGSPYIISILYTLVEDALRGERRSLRPVRERARERFGHLLVARAALVAFLLAIATTIIMSVSVVSLSMFVSLDSGLQFTLPSPNALTGLTVFTAVIFLIPVIPMVAIQHYDVAIVLDNFDSTSGFFTSINLVWQNPADSGGYTVARLVLTLIFSVPATIIRSVATALIIAHQAPSVWLPESITTILTNMPTDFLVMLLLIAIVVDTGATALKRTFHVTYYQTALREKLSSANTPRNRL